MKKIFASLLLAALFVPSFASAALTDNLQGYWKLDESSGNPVDSSGNSRTLTNNNTTAFATGKIGNGADLERSSDNYFTRTNDFNTTAQTVNCWINIESNPLVLYFAGNSSNSSNRGFSLRVKEDNYLQGTISASDAVTGATALSTGVFYMATYTFNTDRQEVFLNGTSDGANETNYTYDTTSTNNFSLGTLLENSTQDWDGILDECGMWSSVLSGAEITELYNAGSGLSYPFVAASPSKVPDLILISLGDWVWHNYQRGPIPPRFSSPTIWL